MRSIEASGKSIDEAIYKGLSELGISIDEVEIEILRQESKGLLGIGSRLAVVRLTEREPEEMVIPEYIRTPMNAVRSDRPTGDSHSAQAAQRPATHNDRRAHNDREAHDGKPYNISSNYSIEAAQNNPAAEFLSGVLERMGVNARVLAAPKGEDDAVRLYIDSSTMGILIGHRGETLDALQYLISLTINRNRKEEGYTRVALDTEGYREKREETLTRLARKIAAQVKASGKPKTLEPMNPYERRVLHATLQNNQYVTTHSEGEEPNRRVVIEPRK
ncbi:MAG: RNA-binding cell elongation regulator Jag/EloR [Clostridia bacterium]